MKEIATEEDPMNNTCSLKQLLTSKDQYDLMCKAFPSLETHCSCNQLQHWIGQANIWGESTRLRQNDRKLGRDLWVVNEQLMGKIASLSFEFPHLNNFVAFASDTSDSVKAYWKYLQHDTKYTTLGYACKSPTEETKASRIRLLQLMISKL